ncbi:NAD(P)H-binding protein [Histidinibacterium lentulum]|uniref:SDR family NAD(P)-dependent oxidoreductase n=1 Tax=Histidinibacterium lentulum TaxID=2480588 RepID=A0A3N2QY20_9RHOB|nr:NAD(P)H-binding protein [Histidinibacterium lentulum]ROU00134.1 SDR family NAD(P)-dependent oxidoreductase [Histidinibacterium lentulum]
MSSAPAILVTGATGKTGREVCAALARRGVVPLRGVRRPGQPEDRALDFTDPGGWDAALAGVEALFLMRPPAIADIAATLGPFVTRARAVGVRHLVFLSVAGADRLPVLPHAKVEARLAAGGQRDWTVLRPDFFAQNLEDAYLRDIREADRIYVPAGRGRIAFVDLADVGEAAAACLLDPGGHAGAAWHLTGPEAVAMGEVAGLLTEALGRRIRYVPASVPGYLRHLRRAGQPWGQAAVQTALHLGLRFGRSAEVSRDLAKVLGRPGGTMAAYVARRAEVWRRAG